VLHELHDEYGGGRLEATILSERWSNGCEIRGHFLNLIFILWGAFLRARLWGMFYSTGGFIGTNPFPPAI
jgi:hypothetical protein